MSIQIIIGVLTIFFVAIFSDYSQMQNGEVQILSFNAIQKVFKIIFFNALLTPIYEEITFRLGLSKNLTFQFVGLLALSSVVGDWKFSALAFVVLSLIVYARKSLLFQLNYKSILFFSAIFGFAHIFSRIKDLSYDFWIIGLFGILVFLQYTIAGFLLSIIRIRLGLIYSIFSHCIVNFFANGYLFYRVESLKNSIFLEGLAYIYIAVIVFGLVFPVTPWFCKYQTKLLNSG